MKPILYILLLSVPAFLTGQEGVPADPAALEASRELTAEANEDLAERDFISAEAKYRKAIARSPENSVAPYNLGNAYYSDGSYGEAFGRYKEAGERALEKDGKHMAYHNMGNVYMQRKEYQKAVDAYKEALRNNPGDEETRYNLALAKEMLKKDQQDQQQDEDENQQDQQEEDQQENQDQNQDQDQGGSDEQQQDQQQDGESEKEENKEGDGEQKQEEDRKPKEQQQQPRPNQLSPQQIQNLLQAMENEEKKVKEKIDAKKVKGKKVTTEKDW